MKKILYITILAVAIPAFACSDDETYTVYECTPEYPYLSTLTLRCYKTEDDLDEDEFRYHAEKDSQANGQTSDK